MNNFWGKPGAGAPRPEGAKKVNIEAALHNNTRKEVGDFLTSSVTRLTDPIKG